MAASLGRPPFPRGHAGWQHRRGGTDCDIARTSQHPLRIRGHGAGLAHHRPVRAGVDPQRTGAPPRRMDDPLLSRHPGTHYLPGGHPHARGVHDRVATTRWNRMAPVALMGGAVGGLRDGPAHPARAREVPLAADRVDAFDRGMTAQSPSTFDPKCAFALLQAPA